MFCKNESRIIKLGLDAYYESAEAYGFGGKVKSLIPIIKFQDKAPLYANCVSLHIKYHSCTKRFSLYPRHI